METAGEEEDGESDAGEDNVSPEERDAPEDNTYVEGDTKGI